MSRREDLTSVIQKPVEAVEKTIDEKIEVNIKVLDECFEWQDMVMDKDYNQEELSEFKLGGALCFWIKKLKPFRMVDDNSPYVTLVNEILAFTIAYYFVFGYLSAKTDRNLNSPKITSAYMNDIIKSLRYKSSSPHALILVFEALSI